MSVNNDRSYAVPLENAYLFLDGQLKLDALRVRLCPDEPSVNQPHLRIKSVERLRDMGGDVPPSPLADAKGKAE